jgi:exodeoxyribonuclease VII large subunit
MTQRGLFDGSNRKPRARTLGVAELVRRAHATLEREFGPLWIEGEVANLKLASSGHAYFSLRDEQAAISVAMWRASVQRLRFRLAEGQRLRVFGRVGIYVQQGRFQFYGERAETAGQGDLMLELERRKQRLSAEGLFDRDRKRPIPTDPRRIGVVSSPQGAAIHDFLKVIRRRSPTDVLLSPARVQGDEAPHELRRALRRLQEQPDIDVIVITRGGGSLEDLWAFNNEGVVRAIATCPVPVISAVGHEVDVTLSDLVADVRAATPSHAGELAVPDRMALRRRLVDLERSLVLGCERAVLDARARHRDLGRRLDARGDGLLADARGRIRAAHHRLERAGDQLGRRDRARLDALSDRLRIADPRVRIAADRKRVATLRHAADRAIAQRVTEARLRLVRSAGSLHALSPLRVLERGYAVVSTDSGAAVRDAAEVEVGEALDVRLHQGRLRVRVEES